jgi:hypothetical protein
MIYRSSTFGEGQISRNVAEKYKMTIVGAMEWISNFCDQIHNLLENLIIMIYRSSTFGEGQISRNVAEKYKMAVAGATEWISNFGGQIRNLLENLIRMIYRSSTFSEGQISRNVAEKCKVAVAGATEWISNFGGHIRNLLENLIRMIYNTSYLSRLYFPVIKLFLVYTIYGMVQAASSRSECHEILLYWLTWLWRKVGPSNVFIIIISARLCN